MGLIIDNFAGGGGASKGIEMATGRGVDVAINHDPDAITMHMINHPQTKHYCEDVWDVNPLEATNGKQVDLAWFSPDCKHFSKAKGGKPLEKKIRGLAWIVLKWAGKVKPKVIILENVEEFEGWGPLKKGRPIKNKKGLTFNRWKQQLESLGYTVDFKQLKACDYGAPTNRKRFFLIARRDGMPIVWPNATHSSPDSIEVLFGLKQPYKTAASIIDWNIPNVSIFNRQKPLSENTLKRIAKGLEKFVFNTPDIFLLKKENELKTGFISKNYAGQSRSVASSLNDCLHTVTARQCHCLVEVTLKEQGSFPNVENYLSNYYGKVVFGDRKKEKDISTNICIDGKNFIISDIEIRSLEPKELFLAQGFPSDYIIEKDINGKTYPKAKQIARCGNAVPPCFSKVLVEANCPWLCNNSEYNINYKSFSDESYI